MRLIPAIERDLALVRAVQTPAGRAALLALFVACLAVPLSLRAALATGVVLALTTFLPAHRRAIMVLAAPVFVLGVSPIDWSVARWAFERSGSASSGWRFDAVRASSIGLVLLVCAAIHRFVERRPSSFVARQPAWTLVGGFLFLLGVLGSAPAAGAPRAYGWAFAVAFGPYLWFLAYSLVDVRRTRERGFVRQLGLYRPFWGSSNVPLPKGEAYVDKIEARDAQALALCQLKGFKLLLWAIILLVVQQAMRTIVGGEQALSRLVTVRFPLPTLDVALAASIGGAPLPWHTGWAAMFLDLAFRALSLAVWGHQVIAVARMAGFDARRNTYKPFHATSVSGFFNGYYYYFKELLVDCFFYPVFLRTLKRHFRLRLFVATFMAAGLGNFAYHVCRDLHFVAVRGFAQALLDARVHFLYCCLLSVCVFLSQLRRMVASHEPKSTVGLWGARASVWTIFAVLNSFLALPHASSVTDHLVFLWRCIPGT